MASILREGIQYVVVLGFGKHVKASDGSGRIPHELRMKTFGVELFDMAKKPTGTMRSPNEVDEANAGVGEPVFG